jgi:hypothetical protein
LSRILASYRSIPKQKAATSEAAPKEAVQPTASLCDGVASRSVNATTAPLNKAHKTAMMSSPRYVSDSGETMAASGFGTLGTMTTVRPLFTTLLSFPWAVRREAPHRATNTAWSGAIRP